MLVVIATTLSAKWLTIHNDFFQYDLEGNPVRTRSGCLSKFGETYYWYGCDAAMTNQTCYSSNDLLHWKNHGSMLKATRGTNRMDVIYNDSTKTYVMILKWETEGSDAWCTRGIATSKSPSGPFEKQFDSLVYGVNTGDISVFVDDDKKAYYLYELWDNGKTSLGFSRMTSDYIGLEKRMQQWSNSDREASMMMKRRGMYYYLTSKMVGIDPSETHYFTAPKIEGPWTTRLVSVIAPGDADRKSWDTQCDYVFAFKGTEDTLQMYCGDRWVKPHPARNGDYVWLPLTFSPRDSVILNYYQDWEVDPDRGIWRAIDSKRNLALQKPTTASSVNGSNTAGKATDPSTRDNYLNSRWESATSDPQWIMVDLEASVKINRVILKWDSAYAKTFCIQVATDTSSWTDVYRTSRGCARSVTDETFTTTTARYVRMYGTERGNTTKGYSLYDFMVLNDSMPTTSMTITTEKSPVTPAVFLTCKNSTVHYRLPFSSFIKLAVVDTRGKLVAILDDGFRNKGNHETILPRNLSSGMYILRLTADTRTYATIQIQL